MENQGIRLMCNLIFHPVGYEFPRFYKPPQNYYFLMVNFNCFLELLDVD